MKLVDLGDGDYDVVADQVRVELSYDGSTWKFWNVRVGEQRFGGTQDVGPGQFRDWLEQHQGALEIARETEEAL